MPAFSNENIGASSVPIVVTLNSSYVPVFATMVQSLFEHRNPQRRYSIFVVSDDILERDLDPIRASLENDRFHIILQPLDQFGSTLSNLVPQEGFSREVFFRFAIPYLFTQFNKVVYIDCDLVLLDDIAHLHDIDLQGNVIGACRDIGTLGMIGGYRPSERERLTESVGMRDPEAYFSAGVLLWDIDSMRRSVTFDQLVNYVLEKNPRYGDQDVLNHFLEGRVLFLDMKWNVLYDSEWIRLSEIVPHAPQEYVAEYIAARSNPSIFHYAGPFKPWHRRVDGSDLFWRQCRRTPFYEDMLRTWTRGDATADLEKKLWPTIDDVYFKLSEGERIRHDLHKRISELELRAQALEERLETTERRNSPFLKRIAAKLPRSRMQSTQPAQSSGLPLPRDGMLNLSNSISEHDSEFCPIPSMASPDASAAELFDIHLKQYALLSATQNSNRVLEQSIASIQESRSFRLGRRITGIPRWLRDHLRLGSLGQ